MSGRLRRFGGPALAVGMASTVCIGAVIFSHYAQVRGKADMRAGVERDKERLRIRRQMKMTASSSSEEGSIPKDS